MGTNYYLKDLRDRLALDDRDGLHIGKSSGGWCFSLHVIPSRGLNTLEDWVALWSQPDMQIKDEYGYPLSGEAMHDVITKRSWKARSEDHFFNEYYTSHAHFLESNHAEQGPNNLLRHRIEGSCVGHGPGTYDYLDCEFS